MAWVWLLLLRLPRRRFRAWLGLAWPPGRRAPQVLALQAWALQRLDPVPEQASPEQVWARQGPVQVLVPVASVQVASVQVALVVMVA